MTRMDAYYRKTRRPIANLSSSLKRPPPKSHISSPHTTTPTTITTASTAASTAATTQTISFKTLSSSTARFIQNLHEHDDAPQSPPKTPRRLQRPVVESPPPRCTTPTNSRLTRPTQPPPVKRKLMPDDLRRKKKPALSVKELFKSAHPLNEEDHTTEQQVSDNDIERKSPQIWKSPIKQQASSIISSPQKQQDTLASTSETSIAESFGIKKLDLPATPPATPRKHSEKLEQFRRLQKLSPRKQFQLQPESPSKITSGPLKGISTSLLDLIRAKEAKAKETPEQRRLRELLGIAPDIARIVPTLFIAHKRDVMPLEKVVDKCYKALRSNYSSLTIIECLELMNKVAPEWATVVEISKGKFMRLNKNNYSLPQLQEAIKRYKIEKIC